MSEVSTLPPPVAAVAYVGNSEKKCVLQLLVEPGEEVTAKELTARFAAAQNPSEAVKYGSLNNLPQTVMKSHRKTGLFETAYELCYSTWWVRKAEDTAVADSVAGHMLALSAENELSLEELWGKVSTAPGKNNSPWIRTLLFARLSGLASGNSISLGELHSDTGVPYKSVHKQITKLHERGFVEYSAVGLNNQSTSFALVSGATPTCSTETARGPRVRSQIRYAGALTLRTKVGLILTDAQQAGQTDITYDMLTEKLSAEDDVNLDNLQGVMGVMLREGIIIRRHKSPLQGDIFSDVQLNVAQKAIIDRCDQIVGGLNAGDGTVLQQGLDHGVAIMDNRDTVTYLLRKGYERSPLTPPLH